MSVAPSSRQERIKRITSAFMPLIWISTRQFSQKLQSFGLTQPQFVALASLAMHQRPCTMHDLTNVTFQDPATMTGIVNRLVAMKLVQRIRSETDRRVVWVQATPVGVDLCARIKESLQHDAMAGYAALTDDDLAALEQLLGYLLRIHVSPIASLKGADLDAEIEKLQLFTSDPISYVKSETR